MLHIQLDEFVTGYPADHCHFTVFVQKIIADEFNMHDAARGGVTKKGCDTMLLFKT